MWGSGVSSVPAWVWAGAGVILLLLESLHGAFILSILGAAALVTAGIDVLMPSLPLTLIAFAILGALGLWLLRPAVLQTLHRGPAPAESNVNALLGATCRVLVPFDAEGIGRVRVGGEAWRAHLRNGGAVWTPNTPLRVVGCEGTTLEVAPAAAEQGAGT